MCTPAKRRRNPQGSQEMLLRAWALMDAIRAFISAEDIHLGEDDPDWDTLAEDARGMLWAVEHGAAALECEMAAFPGMLDRHIAEALAGGDMENALQMAQLKKAGYAERQPDAQPVLVDA